MFNRLFLSVFSLLFCVCVQAQVLPAIHVDGDQLRDGDGNIVYLQGVAVSPDPSADNCRWGILTIDDSIPACLAYYDKVYDALADKEQGSRVNAIRLHLDYNWTNDPNKVTDGRYLGGADISCFSPNRLKNYMKKLYWPLIGKALQHGMYVIVRAPGVCQGKISVDGDYQDYLMTVWDIVTSNDSIRKYSGQISIELANEPSGILDAKGEETEKAVRDFFQPIINLIRENGFDGIIWAPGTSWQSDYRAYVSYPLNDSNLGFAVHDYAGWFSVDENDNDIDKAVANFQTYVPVARTNPIMITEVDWSPIDPNSGHYDELNNWVLGNYGTICTATTSNWGKTVKAILDSYDNMGVTVSSPDVYVDIDEYIKNGKVGPAFAGMTEACGEQFFAWFKEWMTGKPASLNSRSTFDKDSIFAFDSSHFNSHILYENSLVCADTIHTIQLLEGGCAGWRFYNGGADLSGYVGMDVELAKGPANGAILKIYDTQDYWAEPFVLSLNGKGNSLHIDLQDMVTDSGRKLDPSHICIVAFQSDSRQDISVRNISLELPDGIDSVIAGNASDVTVFNLMGMPVDINRAQSGIYIRNGKKFYHR